MIATVALSLLLGAATTDQTVDVKKGMRLEVHNNMGDVNIKVWNRDAVRVEADHSDRQAVDIRRGDQSIVIRRQSGLGAIDYTITIPSWMAVTVDGAATDVDLDGVGGDVTVETARGDIHLRGGSGFISVKSVQGRITIEGSKGRVDAQTVNESIRISGATGDLSATTTNGGIALDRIDTSNLDASTVNGAISFDGVIHDKGSYRLSTHNGAVAMAMPAKVNATLRVRTYGGSFRSTFPLKLDDQERPNRFTLTLGDGSARVELDSFNGSISLRRPGEPRSDERDRDRDRGRGRGRNAPPSPPTPPSPPR